MLPHFTNGPHRLKPAIGAPPSFAIKLNDAGEVGIVFEQLGEACFDPPVDLIFGPVLFKQPQNRQGLDDVSEGAGF
jgi:hypothetical protein